MKSFVWTGLAVALAYVLWAVMFVWRPFNFWLMMSFSTAVISIIAFALRGRMWNAKEWTWRNIVLGVVSAMVLWGVFWLGNQFLTLVETLLPQLPLDRAENIGSVYANREELAPWMVGVLLFFPIGFGEEVFWRGLVQAKLAERIKPVAAWLLATALYMGAHIATGNVVLLIAALVCGLFWGGMYLKTGSLVPVLISHMIWDPLIFVLLPVS